MEKFVQAMMQILFSIPTNKYNSNKYRKYAVDSIQSSNSKIDKYKHTKRLYAFHIHTVDRIQCF